MCTTVFEKKDVYHRSTVMYAKHSPASHVNLHYNLGYLYTRMLHILAQSCPSELFSAEVLCAAMLSILNAHVQICATIRNTTLKNPSFTFHKVISQLETLRRTASAQHTGKGIKEF